MTDIALPAELVGEHFRITPVTPRVVRLEYSPSGAFEDRPSTFAINRDVVLDPSEYTIGEYQGRLTVETENFYLEYDRGPFTANGLKVEVKGGVSAYHSVWRYGQDLSLPADRQLALNGETQRALDGNLGGAARTLDVADGKIPLEPGVNSAGGDAEIDDSSSMVFDADGRLRARAAEEGSIDLFVFAAGRDHVAAVRDYFAISGPQPIVPKFALGNWWSRYHRYSEESYLELMDAFRAEDIPFSVSVIDMDWHLTDVDPKYGSGWTGYTWNRDLFPDPERFLEELHKRGLRVTLNIHPADGVRAFEDAYEAMCEALGKPADGTAIPFDVNNDEFMDAYFDVLHKRLEDEGTDFWWIDWQSGPYSSVEGVDPLWVLNHEHFTRSVRSIERPLTFSRFAGPGSHRYPVGFSGDAIVTWESLAFQPGFTAAAANIGYGWWSHDIGGHMEGFRDNELATRWVQFGVFSPINRLHSSNSPFAVKEPWNFPAPHGEIQAAHLRLRHRLVPYLHSMNYRAHHEGRSIVEPVYFEAPQYPTYRNDQGYLFGSELLVAPITRPAAKDVGRGSVEPILPGGMWFDLFTEQRYGTPDSGAFTQEMFRPLGSIPVLVRAGGILPLTPAGEVPEKIEDNPEVLELIVAAGGDGEFTLHEEWKSGDDLVWSHVRVAVQASENTLSITIPADTPEVAREALEQREWRVRLLGHDPAAFGDLEAQSSDATFAPGAEKLADELRIRKLSPADRPAPHAATITVTGLKVGEEATLTSAGFGTVLDDTEKGREVRYARLRSLVNDAEIGFTLKQAIAGVAAKRPESLMREISAFGKAPSGHLPRTFDYEQASPELIAAVAEIWG